MIIRYANLFSGIGGFRVAINNAASGHGIEAECVYACEIDPVCRQTYTANFSGPLLRKDITKLIASEAPDFDLLVAGFPCQPYSIIGKRQGLGDPRGGLFFDLLRFIDCKKPEAFLLENVKQLERHDRGATLRLMTGLLHDVGYWVDSRVLNALDFGLPQKRERLFIVGFKCGEEAFLRFEWPQRGIPITPLNQVLEATVGSRYFASERIRRKRASAMRGREVPTPAIWHENKSGHVSAHPYSCALRANASYNYLLVDGTRRLTERELLRLQGFPEWFHIPYSYSQVRKLVGNTVPIPVVEAVIDKILDATMGD